MKRCFLMLLCCLICMTAGGCTQMATSSSFADIYTDASSGTLSFSTQTDSEASGSSSRSKTKGSAKTSSKQSGRSSKPKDTSSKPPAFKSISIRNSNRTAFHTVGRAIPATGSGLQLGWGGSAIAFDLLCEREIRLSFTLTAAPEETFRSVWVRISVDGKPVFSGRTEIALSTLLTVATDLPYGTHRVEIVRLTDGEAPPLRLTEIQTYGSLVLQAPSPKKLYIEAIGDDALLGRGVLSNDPALTGASAVSSALQDATKTYPYLAAEALQADCYLLARVGAGLATGYLQTTVSENGATKRVADPLGILPNIYSYTDLYTKGVHTVTRAPDVIVLDAGRADIQSSLLQAVPPNGISGSKATDRAVAFLKQLKQSYPSATILWCYGFLYRSPALKTRMESVIRMAGGETAGIHMLELDPATRTGVPTLSDHKAAAIALQQAIRTLR